MQYIVINIAYQWYIISTRDHRSTSTIRLILSI